MALIWAEGFTGPKALAPAWRELALANVRAAQFNPSQWQEYAAAAEARRTAKMKYDVLVDEATEALKQLGKNGKSRTHVLIVGVGKYDSKNIGALTTSIFGARAFAKWTLTRFSKADRPLGSVELLCSPTADQGDWTPSDEAAKKLGFDAAVPLPDEAATFANIDQAFTSWLARAGTCADNAAIWYFSGHGVFKSEALLLPQDAQLPNDNRSAENLIAPTKTMSYMQNRQPSIQCFFIDACSETSLELTYNVQELPGRALVNPTNAAAIPQIDATIYFGSCPGGKAYGPVDKSPYFTQELLLCLDRRAGDPSEKQVTTGSLSTAIKAAAFHRAEMEDNAEIIFLEHKRASSFTAELCELRGPVEVLVKVDCEPKKAMRSAKLYIVESGDPPGQPTYRRTPRASPWYTPVRKGIWTASAEFDPPIFKGVSEAFEPVPPVFPVCCRLKVQ